MADVNHVVPDAGVPEGSTTDPAMQISVAVTPTGDLVELARGAAVEEAGAAGVGDYLGARSEDSVATSVRFAATDRGYRGWYWLVTVAVVEPSHPTISEVVLLPGDGALLAPAWVPWDQRVRAGDLGVGDLLPTPADDDRLVPGYLDSDDPAVREVDYEFGFGRVRVLGRPGRDDAAQRWHDGPFGPDDPMAKQAPAACATCGFYIRLEGLLGQAFGACSNEFSPADGRVVDAAYGCGAHSETVIDAPLISASTATVMDEVTLDVHVRPAAEPVTGESAAAGPVVDESATAGPALDDAVPLEADPDELRPDAADTAEAVDAVEVEAAGTEPAPAEAEFTTGESGPDDAVAAEPGAEPAVVDTGSDVPLDPAPEPVGGPVAEAEPIPQS